MLQEFLKLAVWQSSRLRPVKIWPATLKEEKLAMGIHISSQLEARLMENAAAMGISTDEYVERLLQEDQRRARERRRQAASRLQELSEQAVLGPDLTLRDLVEEGRR